MPRALVLVLCLVIACTAAALAADEPDRSADPGLEVLMETGMVMPLGNLGAGLPHTPTGMGAERGYRAGLRGRYIAPSGLTISPVFSFSEFGDYDGLYDESGKTGGFNQKYKVQASVIRYGLDVGYLSPGSADQWRVLLAAGVAVVNNRYREELVDDEYVYTASVVSPGWMLSAGVRRGPMEIALEYHASRFETDQFFLETVDGEYVWNHLILRGGWMLPRF